MHIKQEVTYSSLVSTADSIYWKLPTDVLMEVKETNNITKDINGELLENNFIKFGREFWTDSGRYQYVEFYTGRARKSNSREAWDKIIPCHGILSFQEERNGKLSNVPEKPTEIRIEKNIIALTYFYRVILHVLIVHLNEICFQ